MKLNLVVASVALLCLFLSAALAGCTAPDQDEREDGVSQDPTGVDGADPPGDDDPEAGTSSFPFPARLDSGSCYIQAVSLGFPRDLAEPFFPEGFEPVPFMDDPTGNLISMETGMSRCGNATADGLVVEPLIEYRLHFHTNPPAEHTDPEVDVYWLPVFGITSAQEVQDLYANWNLSWITGESAFDVEIMDSFRTGTGETQADGQTGEQWSLEMETTVQTTDVTCRDGMTFRSFGFDDNREAPTNYVDASLNADCVAIGSGRVHFEPWSTDPDVLTWWILTSAVQKGVGIHIWSEDEPLEWTQHYVPLTSA